MKRTHYLLAIIIAIILNTNTVIAQREPLSVAVGYEFAASEDVVRLNELVVSLESQLQTAFENEGIEIVLTNDPENANIYVILDLVSEQTNLYIDVIASNPPHTLLPSEFLVPHIFGQLPLSGAPDDPLLTGTAVQIIVGMGAYTLGDCDTVTTQFTASQPASGSLGLFGHQVIAYTNFYLGNCALVAEDYDSAAAFYQANMDIYQEHNFDQYYRIEASVNLAWVTYLAGETETAFGLLEINPPHHAEWMGVYPLLMRSNLYAQEMDYESAIADSNAAAKITPDNPALYIWNARIMMLMEAWDDALHEIGYVNKMSKDRHPEAIFYEGLIFYETGRTADALPLFQAYLQVEPEGRRATNAQEYIDLINGN
jgi:tetratricopeptide (TPR) repeat protein